MFIFIFETVLTVDMILISLDSFDLNDILQSIKNLIFSIKDK